MSVPPSNPRIHSTNSAIFRARNYQLEMWDHSLKGNVIVAMDTGSGKTHVAVLRIMSALERCDPDKLVWFLGPTVALCTQQHGVLLAHLPAARIRLLLGSDNVDCWSEKRIWDAVLKDLHIVISTYAVLADALSHGFVTMARLALLIFDEAHHCARGHPANKIMETYYHPTKREKGSVPDILGLTASPIKSSKPQELQAIEANLDAISISPRRYRQELLKHVHRPRLIALTYLQYDAETHICSSLMLQKLKLLCRQERVTVDVIRDVDNLKLHTHKNSVLKRQEISWVREAFCMDQLKKFYSKAQHIYEELGQWASDYFIIESVRRFMNAVDVTKGIFDEWQTNDKIFIRQVLSELQIDDVDIGIPAKVSSKLACLISYLANRKVPDFSGLLFVQQRATASILSALLSRHPETKNDFCCAPYVGLSSSAKRKQNIGELLDRQAMYNTLEDFRERRKNLIISTEVLEEGIDVASCNMVICFNKIPTIKSFIQRRGRARQEKSTYAIMLASNDTSSKIDYFQQLEAEMSLIYQNEERLQKEASAREAIQEDDNEVYVVESSQARITAQFSVAHIYHFCRKLPPEPYVDLNPTFQIAEDKETGLVQAILILPSCVNSTVRRTSGTKWWQTERSAKKDAALQACKALHIAGLLSEHLLPFSRPRQILEDPGILETLPTIDIRAQFNPWNRLALAWDQPQFHRITMFIQRQDETEEKAERLFLTTPLALPLIQPFQLYWSNEITFIVSIEHSESTAQFDRGTIELMRDVTHVFMRAGHSDYVTDDRKDYIALLTSETQAQTLKNWLRINKGRRTALEQFHFDRRGICPGLVRTSLKYGTPYMFRHWRTASSDVNEIDELELQIECSPLRKRRDFLQPAKVSQQVHIGDPVADNITSGEIQIFPANLCTIDAFPLEQAKMSLFIPSILRHFEVTMIASELRQTILRDIPFENIDNVVEAISAPSAQWVTNYQRYEFLGDSILKFVVSNQLFVRYPAWHEGYLSGRRANLVSNTCLAKATLDAKLDAFIITEQFKARKWNLPRISDVDRCVETQRNVSTKMLADVAEALIGAAYLDGGLPMAIKLMNTLSIGIHTPLPEPSLGRRLHIKNDGILKEAQRLIGYQFQDMTLLLEALTHPSYEADTLSESYQRLEFLGDAVLDMILVRIFSTNKISLSHGDMTKTKAALVNADLLAFFCLELSLPYDVTTVQQQDNGQFGTVHSHGATAFWKFMRCHSKEIVLAQQECLIRHEKLREEISLSTKHGKSYPWNLLAQLNADKFFSDIIESTVGAIFVDSGENLLECQNFLRRIGLVPYLLRILEESVDTIHPKTVLGHLAGSAKIVYDVQCEEGNGGVYHCVLKIDDFELIKMGDIGGCSNRNEAMIRAADAAVRLLSN